MHFAGKLAGPTENEDKGGQPEEKGPRLHAAGSAPPPHPQLPPPHPQLPPPPPHPQLPPPHPQPRLSPWPDRLQALGEWLLGQLNRPRVRLCVIGLVLLLLGGLVSTSSVWTLPLVVVGAVMVLVAWIGSRLDGRFAVEWGETGTQLELRAQIKAPTPERPALARTVAVTAGFEPDEADVVEGEAHTVEIDVAELKALIAAAEAADAELARAQQRPAA